MHEHWMELTLRSPDDEEVTLDSDAKAFTEALNQYRQSGHMDYLIEVDGDWGYGLCYSPSDINWEGFDEVYIDTRAEYDAKTDRMVAQTTNQYWYVNKAKYKENR